MEPIIEERSAFRVVGLFYRGKGENDVIPQMWAKVVRRIPEIRQYLASDESYGVMDHYDQTTGEFDYLAGFAVTDEAPVPEGMAEWRVPAQTYAVFSSTLPNLGEVYRNVRGTWLPQSGRVAARGPEFECYPREFDPEDSDSVLFLYIPVR